jgi:hypothetical protein
VEHENQDHPDAAGGRAPLPRWLPFVLAVVLLSLLLMGPPVMRALMADEAPPPSSTPPSTLVELPPGDDPG